MAVKPEIFNEEGTAFTIFPIYLVIDVSQSMGWPTPSGPDPDAMARGAVPPIVALNREYQALVKELKRSPLIRATAQLSIITFSEDAAVAVPLGTIDDSYEFFATGRTRFTRAFDLLRRQIEEDMLDLRKQPRSHYRPTVIVLTDGQPDPAHEEELTWPSAHAALVDKSFQFHPHVFAIGFGGADESFLSAIAAGRGRALVAEPDADTSAQLVRILEQIKFSVFNAQDGTLIVESEPGLREVRFDDDVPDE